MTDTLADHAPFIPAAPARLDKAYPAWSYFFAGPRDVLHRWPKAAFELPYAAEPIIGARLHMVCDPDAIRHILLDNAANYRRPRLIQRILRGLMGDSLFTVEADAWKEQRRLMAPVFKPSALNDFAPVFHAAAARTADRWTGGRIDISVEATRAAFDVITEALFSNEPGMSYDEAADHLLAALSSAGSLSAMQFVGLGWLDRSARARRGRDARAFIAERFESLIARRQADPDPPQDFVTRLIGAFSETHGPEAAAKLTFDNAVTFFGAGHETNASGLTWAFYLLSRDAAVQDRARAEAVAALAAGGTLDELLSRLTYLRQVWDEALRLYPPASRIDREAIGADEICGHRVRKGDWIIIPTWVLHRHRTLWRNPDRFDPEHFTPEAKARQHRFQYLPFGAGPRICIGMAFANAEALVVLAHWLARFRFSPDPDHEVVPTSAITIRPRGGLPIVIEGSPKHRASTPTQG